MRLSDNIICELDRSESFQNLNSMIVFNAIILGAHTSTICRQKKRVGGIISKKTSCLNRPIAVYLQTMIAHCLPTKSPAFCKSLPHLNSTQALLHALQHSWQFSCIAVVPRKCRKSHYFQRSGKVLPTAKRASIRNEIELSSFLSFKMIRNQGT